MVQESGTTPSGGPDVASDGPDVTPDATPDGQPLREPDIRRHELAGFLRSRRERILPEQVGLPRGIRRRTPGLRREEVAQLSAVGVTWYTWLEQARPIQVSAQVLDALSRALLLDRSERAHLFALAGAVDPAPGTPCATITPAVRSMLERLEPFPACVQNSRYDILAYNRTYALMMRDMDALAPEDRNCIWLAFTDAQWQASLMNPRETKRTLVARFRSDMAEHLAEPPWKALLARLRNASPEFREIWERHEVIGNTTRSKRFVNARVGTLNVVHTNLWLGPTAGSRLVSYVPEDEETRARLEKLLTLKTLEARQPAAL
ncbi:helix-turn-helix domain-containing protein [Streptomyces liangshanensis]|uniref:Helix-turn-helix domain-containing protein n=2 Tax=Streptomyces liangshanensis TaxID=2717324 RepID=A0A6G9H475_9ACTN|nr:helix-turn-helix transcriptional regulator [Streptomyces liangshanensis]QIQ04917.1 helix-turn-helix domain-containing protein [Streptomyces liangshanensis]